MEVSNAIDNNNNNSDSNMLNSNNQDSLVMIDLAADACSSQLVLSDRIILMAGDDQPPDIDLIASNLTPPAFFLLFSAHPILSLLRSLPHSLS